MTDGDRQASWLKCWRRKEIPLIEDDVYGELGFRPGPPFSLKGVGPEGPESSVFLLLPRPWPRGYRVGGSLPGRYRDRVELTSRPLFNVATGVAHATCHRGEFLGSGGTTGTFVRFARTYAHQAPRCAPRSGRWLPGPNPCQPAGGGFRAMGRDASGTRFGFRRLRTSTFAAALVSPGCLFTTVMVSGTACGLSARGFGRRDCPGGPHPRAHRHDAVDTSAARDPSLRKAGG